MTEVNNPRVALLENLRLVITGASGVGTTTKWLDSVVSFALSCGGYSIVIAGAYLRQNQRNMALFTFLAVNTGFGESNWM